MTRVLLALLAAALIGLACERAPDPPPTEPPAQAAVDEAPAPAAVELPALQPIEAPAPAIAPAALEQPPDPAPTEPTEQPPAEVEPPDPIAGPQAVLHPHLHPRHTGHASKTTSLGPVPSNAPPLRC